MSEAHKAVNQIRQIRTQINGYTKSIKEPKVAEKFKEAAKPMLEDLDKIESTLMQPKSKAPQDALAYPIQLNDKMAGIAAVVSSADTKPTQSSQAAYDNLSKQIDSAVGKLNEVVNTKVPAFNRMVTEQQIPAIIIN